MQPAPYALYQSNPKYTGAKSLWIEGETAWTQYAVVPQVATVSLFAISPSGGSGLLAFEDSDGLTYSHNYFFYPNSLNPSTLIQLATNAILCYRRPSEQPSGR
jgi:hypothetical protein